MRSNTKSVIIETTGRCNLRCDYCYADRSPGSIDLALVRTLFGALEDLGITHVDVYWHGGEPLLLGLGFFEQVAEEQRRSGLVFTNSLQTNGILLDQGFADHFASHQFDLGISIDLPACVHEERRGRGSGRGRSSFEAAVSAVRRCRESGIPFGVISVVDDVIPDPAEVIGFLRELEIPSYSVNLAFDSGFDRDDDRASDLLGFLTGIYDLHCEHGLTTAVRELKVIFEHLMGGATTDFCHHCDSFCGDNYFAMSWRGDVYMSCDRLMFGLGDRFKLGNLRDEPLASILESAAAGRRMGAAEELRRSCTSGCHIARFCNGGCVHEKVLHADAAARRPLPPFQESTACQVRRGLYDHIERDFRRDVDRDR